MKNHSLYSIAQNTLCNCNPAMNYFSSFKNTICKWTASSASYTYTVRVKDDDSWRYIDSADNWSNMHSLATVLAKMHQTNVYELETEETRRGCFGYGPPIRKIYRHRYP